jgi:Ca2+-binding RTX toxin-like protein
VIYGDGDNDLIIGATGGDILFGGTGNDLVFGDFAEVVANPSGSIQLGLLPLDLAAHPFVFRSIHTAAGDPAGSDAIAGEGGNDILIGGQGADFITGGDGDDDLIGGHNVADGNDSGDVASGSLRPARSTTRSATRWSPLRRSRTPAAAASGRSCSITTATHRWPVRLAPT